MPIEGINLSTKLVQGFISLDLCDARVLNSSNESAVLSTATNPKLELRSTGAISSANPLCLSYSSAGALSPTMLPQVGTPVDWSTTDGFTVHLITTKGTNAASPTIGVQVQTVDATAGALGMSSGNTGALTSSAPLHVTCAFTAAQAPGINSGIGVVLTPSTNGDAIQVHAAWLTYGRARRG